VRSLLHKNDLRERLGPTYRQEATDSSIPPLDALLLYD
jgi:hypothetical protein